MHPVIAGNKKDFERVAELAGRDTFIAGLYSRAVAKADMLLEEKAEIRYLDEVNFDAAFNLERLDLLSFVYAVTGEERYFKRTLEELDAVCSLDSWQEFKFLNTAAFGMGTAIVYDRLYYALTEPMREKYRCTLKRLMLDHALSAYDSDDKEPFGTVGWSKCNTNWNAVCNGAVIAAAAAIYDDEPAYSKTVIEKAVRSLKLFLEIFEPCGAFEEGISYWFYANLYLSKAVSALNNRFGTDGDIISSPGFRKSLEYAEAMNHDAFNFNFHDVGTERRIDTSPLMYYARRLNMPNLGRSRIVAFAKGFLPVADEVIVSDMLWYDEAYSRYMPESAAADVYFPQTEVCVLRDADIAVALHGGNNAAVHGHLDNGTVILDSAGKRWLCDLGKDMLTYSFEGIKYFRWDLYRMRPEGHNCLVINPGKAPGQSLDAVAKITEFSTGNISCARMDLTSSYENAVSITRSIVFDKRARVVEITDDILLKENCDIYSFWHTRADVSADGAGAVLSYGEQCISISCNYPLGLMKAEPLDSSPKIPPQAKNDGVCKLFIRLENIKETKIILKIYL